MFSEFPSNYITKIIVICREHQEFLRAFVQSQQFSTYTEKLLELMKKKATNAQKKPGHKKGSLSVEEFKNIFNTRLHRTVSSVDILPSSSPDRADS